jgi:CRISPR system Cascade subunit CasA
MTLRVRDLDPFYIEICRRVRIVGAAGRLCFRAKPTKSARVEAKVLKGNTGDSWTPVDVKRGAALTVSRNGFDYKKVREILLSGNFKLGGALEIRSDDPVDGLSFHATALTRGQGKTEGLHERAIPVPKNVRSMMLLPGQRERLTKISQRRIEDASLLEQKVLWPSLSRLGLAPDWANRWSHALDRRIDDIFFGELWNSVEEDEDHAREAWLRKITEMGRETLRAAERAAPIPAARRLRAIAEAELMYEGTLRKRFPELHTKEGS